MTFAYWMLLAAAMLPYLTIGLAKSAGGIDNRAPRLSFESLSGWRQRADWAHRNHFEAFPAFAAAVFVAELTHAPQNRIDQLAGMELSGALTAYLAEITEKLIREEVHGETAEAEERNEPARLGP